MLPNQIPHYNSLSRRVVIFIAWQNIWTKKLRSSLTILGVVIGLGAIFFLLSIGFGLQRLVTEEVIGNQSVKTIDVVSPNSSIIQLNKENTERIKQLPRVDRTSGLYAASGVARLDTSEVDSIVYGVDAAYQDIASIPVVKGTFLKANTDDQVVVNSTFLSSIGIQSPDKAIGKKLELAVTPEDSENGTQTSKKVSLNIVGVTSTGSGSEIYVPAYIVEQTQRGVFKQLKVVTGNTKEVPNIRKQIESLGFETRSPLDTISQIEQLFRYLNMILIGIGSIGMIVAILGMFNTLTISLLERTREIGLMISVGVRNKDVKRLFMYESLILSVLGSTIGIALAVTSGSIMNMVMRNLASSRGFNEKFSVFYAPWWLPLGMVLFMVFVGTCVAFFPAKRAANISPVDALRDD